MLPGVPTSRPKNLQDGDLFPTLSVFDCFCSSMQENLQNHWILVLKPQGSLSLLSSDQKKTDENFPGMRIMMKMMGGQTCSSWLLPGRHLKGFECDRLLLPCRALMGIFAESWMRAGQKNLTRPWLIFYGLLVLWANVARWRKIIGPKSGTIIIFCFVLYSVCPYKRRANKSFEEDKAFLLAFRGSSKHVMYAHYSCVHLLSAHSRSLHLLLSEYSWLLLCTICFRVK